MSAGLTARKRRKLRCFFINSKGGKQGPNLLTLAEKVTNEVSSCTSLKMAERRGAKRAESSLDYLSLYPYGLKDRTVI